MIKNHYVISLLSAIVLFVLLTMWNDQDWSLALVITAVVTITMFLLEPIVIGKFIPWIINKLGL